MDAPSSSHFYAAADEVFEKLQEIVESPQPLDDATALHIQALALIGRLKALNRAANNTTRLQKDATTESRQEMDQAHLGLQNLLYEKRHLEREIEKCRQFA
jgi:THO complex subunit 5